jgi:hypothetical protein
METQARIIKSRKDKVKKKLGNLQPRSGVTLIIHFENQQPELISGPVEEWSPNLVSVVGPWTFCESYHKLLYLYSGVSLKWISKS